jgi:hypothetical protein
VHAFVNILQVAEGWSITLHWQDILNILLAALAVFQFFRNRKTKEVCNEVLKRQAVQTAAHGFAEMARTAYDLETWVGKSEWERSLELAKTMMVSLAEGSGAWSGILETADVDIFAAARTEITSVEKSVLLAMQNAPTPQQTEQMKLQCINAATYLAEIAGRLKKPSELKESLKKSKQLAKSVEGK